MLLRRLELENFRGLRHARVDFDDTTAIIGENGAGKSTLLDALAICLAGGDDQVHLEPRDFHRGADGTVATTLRMTLTFEQASAPAAPVDLGALAGLTTSLGGLRQLRLEVTGHVKPGVRGTWAEWAFGEGASRATSTSAPGLLAEWRRRHPILRVRANRYVELSPRGPAPAEAARGSDPVVAQLERQIRRVYQRLTGAADVTAEELTQGLAAVDTYLAEHAPQVAPLPSAAPRVIGDVAEAPLRSGRNPQALRSSIKQGAGVRGLALVALIGVLLEAGRRQGFTLGSRPLLLLEDAEAHLHPLTLSAMWEMIAALPAQKVLTTNSGELLASVPLRSIRRLTTGPEGTRVHRVDTEQYRVDDLRRIAYHVRVNRAGAFFARCWLLVEGETEAWLLPELAQLCGYDFPAEGVRCVEYAQCGVRPLIRLASDLGLEWHLLADGDNAGRAYGQSAAEHLHGRPAAQRMTVLEEPDIEHCLFFNGYRNVYEALAGPQADVGPPRRPRERASRIITRAIRARSKPGAALAIIEAANAPGAPAVPAPLRQAVETVVGLARGHGAEAM